MAKKAVVEEVSEATGAEVIASLVKGVNALVQAQASQVRDVPISELKPITPWNKTGERRTKKYKTFYQNGAKLNHDLMSEEELDLFSQLKPGRYNHRKWEVIRRRDKSLDLRYPNATIAQRMDLKGEAPNLVTMLKHIVMEQEEQAERKRRGDYDDDSDD